MLEKGPLKRLAVMVDDDGDKRTKCAGLLKGHLGSLEFLWWTVKGVSGLEQVWGMWEDGDTFVLQDLDLNHEHHLRETPSAIDFRPPPLSLDISSLTRISLQNFELNDNSSLFPLLQRTRNLQTIQLVRPSSISFSLPDATSSNPTVLHLPNLLHLVINRAPVGTFRK